MDGTLSASLPETRVRVHQARKIFAIALTICTILGFNMTILRLHGAGLAACFSPLLFWSLAAAAYAFHSLATAHARLVEQLGNRLVWDRMRGLKQLATIKERLREQTASTPE